MAWPSDSARTKTWITEVLIAADLHTQLDVLHTYVNDFADGSTGHGHTGGTNDGKQINLSTAVTGTLPVTNGGTGQATLAAFLNLIYPIGSVYINVSDSTNPGTLLGFGTWSALGAGRMIVGYDSGDTNFDTAGETGGANTVTLAANQIPSLTVTLPTYSPNSGGSADSVQRGAGAADGSLNVSVNGTGSTAVNTLPKYVTCFTWKRTA